jgi:hypothetical protein
MVEEDSMPHNKKNSLIKDVLIFALLFFIIWLLVIRIRKYVQVNKQSLIHQLETSFIEFIQLLQRQLGVAKQIALFRGITSSHTKLMRHIRTLNNQLHEVEEKYMHNTPGLALLGPLGTTSIVLKEQELQRKLHYIALGINDAFSDLLGRTRLGRTERQTITLDEIIELNDCDARVLRHNR